MQIDFIAPAPFDRINGGYEYDRRIVAGMRALNHEVRVHELEGGHPVADTAAVASARQCWQSLPRNGVVVIDNLALASFAPLNAELATRPLIVLDHHPTGLETGLDDVTRASLIEVEKRLLRHARLVIATSQATADTLAAEFDVASERVCVIEPGTADAPRSRGSAPDGRGAVELLAIGTLIPRKGHDVLLRAIARLPDLDWHLTIAGSARPDPDTAVALKSLAADLTIDSRVTFLGEMTGEPLAALWQQADLFALATHYEGYGMAIAEALKRGLPVAICGGGAAGALVTPQSGVVCPPADIDQLSKALRRLIFDTELRRSLADGAWTAGQSLPNWPTQTARFAQAVASVAD